MKAPEHIVIFHPAAIGDSILGTPVSKVLKTSYPNAKVTYWAHSSLRELITDCCPSVDAFVDFEKKEGIFSLRKRLIGLEADLLIDLSNSTRGKILPLLAGVKALHYRKQSGKQREGVVHAADNFMQTIEPVISRIQDKLFPTLFPPTLQELPGFSSESGLLFQVEEASKTTPLIGIVPGVGNLRPNRRWTKRGWQELLESIAKSGEYGAVIVGGTEDSAIADELAKQLKHVVNLCGRTSLVETAAVLQKCSVVVSADTGPAHLAVAVGTPVIGLYGPTLMARSGPYDCSSISLDQTANCRCVGYKHCSILEDSVDEAGKCMDNIAATAVFDKIERVIRNS